MNKTIAIAFFLLACVSSNANAWFFFFLPGSVTSKIGDAFTGAEGDNCVGSNAKVGDTIRLATGKLMTVKSLSGTSSRCTNAEHPIRALLVPSATVTAPPTPDNMAKEAEAKKSAAEEAANKLAAEEEAKKLAAEEETKKLAAEEDVKRLAAEEEAKRVAAESEAKGIAAEEAAIQIKAEASKHAATRLSPGKVAAISTQQVDFNAEAGKSARVLGCQPSELKVTGIDGANIQYSIVCDNSKTLKLSCDPSGLCLQRKSELRQKK